jgi:selenocysteine-specific elongation factor
MELDGGYEKEAVGLDHAIAIGIAGHIDHGKTALTKALTGIETDRLIEEKRRQISIENGYAFLDVGEGRRVAVIDVPGHERFIRRMIAGVAGIQLVVLTVAADEGIMPQTKEHLAICRLLGVPKMFVALTKTALVDRIRLANVRSAVQAVLMGTEYEGSPIYEVDSLSGAGIDELRSALVSFARTYKGISKKEPLRLPIDDVFTVPGHGTVVRGTIFNGTIRKDGAYVLLPENRPVRIKALQAHHVQVSEAGAGGRVAVNLAAVDRDEVKRGDVLAADGAYEPSLRLDVRLQALEEMSKPLKQRAEIMFHLAAAAIPGRLIFYDRNRWEPGEAVYGQIELSRPVVAKKGDRFIVRRPSPAETLGGGEVINPVAEKHRHRAETVRELKKLAEGEPEDWIKAALKENQIMDGQAILRMTGLDDASRDSVLKRLIAQGEVVEVGAGLYASRFALERVQARLVDRLTAFHERFPLRSGMSLADWRELHDVPEALVEEAERRLKREGTIALQGHLVRLASFSPHAPAAWREPLLALEKKLTAQGLMPAAWADLVKEAEVAETVASDFYHYLLEQGKALRLSEDRLIAVSAVRQGIERLKAATEDRFTIAEAKTILGLTRKFAIPFLELCDRLGVTKREDNVRVWMESVKAWCRE